MSYSNKYSSFLPIHLQVYSVHQVFPFMDQCFFSPVPRLAGSSIHSWVCRQCVMAAVGWWSNSQQIYGAFLRFLNFAPKLTAATGTWNMFEANTAQLQTRQVSRVCLADSLMSNTTGKSMLFSTESLASARNKNCMSSPWGKHEDSVQMQRAFQFGFSSDLEQIFSLKHEVPCPNLLCGSSFGCYFRTSIEKIILSSQSHRNKSKQQAARSTCTDATIRCQRSETGKWKIWKRTWVKAWPPWRLLLY